MRRLSQPRSQSEAMVMGNIASSIEDRASAKTGNRCGIEFA
jgi:hypothetical protein